MNKLELAKAHFEQGLQLVNEALKSQKRKKPKANSVAVKRNAKLLIKSQSK